MNTGIEMVGHKQAGPPVLDRLGDGELAFRVWGTERDGELVRIRSPKCAVGGHESCTLRLRAANMRPVHCWIVRGRTGTFVRRWSKQTLLNGHLFDSAPLHPGDRLTLGAIELELLHVHPDPVEFDGSDASADGRRPDSSLARRAPVEFDGFDPSADGERPDPSLARQAPVEFDGSDPRCDGTIAADTPVCPEVRDAEPREAIAEQIQELEKLVQDYANERLRELHEQTDAHCELAELWVQFAERQQQLDALLAAKEQLEDQLAAAEAEMAGRVDQAERAVTELRAQLETVQAALVDSHARLAEREGELHELRERFEADRAQRLNSEPPTAAAWTEERAALHSQLEDLLLTKEQLEEELAAAELEAELARGGELPEGDNLTDWEGDDLANLRQQLHDVQADLSDARLRLEERESQFVAERQQWDAELARRNESEAQQLASWDQERASLRGQLDELLATKTQLEEQLANADAKLARGGEESERELAEFRQQLHDVQAALAEATGQLAERESQLSVQREQWETEFARRGESEAQQRAFWDQERASLQDQLDELLQTKTNLAEQLAQAESELARGEATEGELTDLRQQLATVQSTLCEATAQFAERESQLAAQCERWEAEFARRSESEAQQRATWDQERASLQGQLDELLQTKTNLAEQLAQAEAELARGEATEGELTDLRQQLATVQSTLCEATAQFAERENQLAAQCERWEAEFARRSESEAQQRAAWDQERASLLDQRDELLQTKARLAEQLTHMEAELARGEAAEGELTNLRQQLADVQTALSETTAQLADRESQHRAQRERWDIERERLESELTQNRGLLIELEQRVHAEQAERELARLQAPHAASESHGSDDPPGYRAAEDWLDSPISTDQPGTLSDHNDPDFGEYADDDERFDEDDEDNDSLVLSTSSPSHPDESSRDEESGREDERGWSPSPPAASSGANEEEDHESIEDYMNRLLMRVRGAAAPEQESLPAFSPPAPLEPSPVVEQVRPPVEPEAVEPSEYRPRSQAPERSGNMEAMRQLANETARSAISKSTRQQLIAKALVNYGVSALAFIVAIACYLLSGGSNLGFVLLTGLCSVAAAFLLRATMILRHVGLARVADDAETDPAPLDSPGR